MFCGHIVDCSEFIWHSFLISAHELIDIYHIFLVFEGHICCWHIYGNSMVLKVSVCCCFLGLVSAIMWGLYADHSSSVVGQICMMWEAYLLRGICQQFEMYCIPVFVVTLLIAVASCEAYIVTQLSH